MFHNEFESLFVPPRRSLVQSLLGGSTSNNISPPKSKPDKNSTFEWTWDVQGENDFVDLLNDDREVTFHRKYSSGTAVVRRTQPMSHDQHFWEIEMISPVYGTDIMVGIGTATANMSQRPNMFTSLLGRDGETWGFSYRGSFYHDGEKKLSFSAFDQGSVIGFHLDMWNGTLSLYKNQKHLGVASRGLKGKTLHAMASSTAACSSMRLLRTCSFPSSLLFLCCAKLREVVPDDRCVLQSVAVPPGLRLFLENNLGWLLKPRCAERLPDAPSPKLRIVIVGHRGLPCAFLAQNRHRRPQTTRDRSSEGDHRLDNDQHGVECGDNGDRVDYVDSDDSSDDEDDEVESKRRRCSYNYAVGLSDPESEADT